jgi:hypothetical protein
MGDAIGTKSYTKLNTATMDKWKLIFGTRYRQKYARRYIHGLGRDTITTLGYNMEHILGEIDAIRPVAKGAFRDIANQIWGRLMSVSEMPMFLKKETDRKTMFMKHHHVHYYS